MKKKTVISAFLCCLSIFSASACAGADTSPKPADTAKDAAVVQVEDVQVSSDSSGDDLLQKIRSMSKEEKRQKFNECVERGDVDYDVKYADNEAYHYYCEHNPDKLGENEEFKEKPQRTLTYEDVERLSSESGTFLEFFKAIQDIQYSAAVSYDSSFNIDITGFNSPGGFTLKYHVTKKDGTPVMVNIGFGYVICSVEGAYEAPVILVRILAVE